MTRACRASFTFTLLSFLFACGDNVDTRPALCGDGFVDEQVEACDDANLIDGDGCDSNCTLPACGNGILGFDESCDDGNAENGDGCDTNCMQSFCGNGIKAADETCDDGNTESGDGCDVNCKITGCGNGVATFGEVCDDGNATDGDGCDSNCSITGCGNGILGGSEQCDDGNTTTADGCSATCALEVTEIEPNDDGDVSTGGSGIVGNDFSITAADANGAYTGTTTIIAALTPMGDEDVFKFSNTGAGPVRVKLDTWNLATGFGIGVSCGTASIDTGIHVRDAAGVSLANNNDRPNSDYCAGLVHALFPGESIYVHVTDWLDNSVVASYALDVVYIPVACGDGDLGPGEQCDDTNTSAGDGCSATCQIEGATTEIEPNEDGTPSTGGTGIDGNDFGSANALANGAIDGDATILASINPNGDEDVFALTNAGATNVTVQVDVWAIAPNLGVGTPCGAAIDTGMHLRDAAGTSLASNDDRNGAMDRCSTLTFGLAPGQTRFAHVIRYGDTAVLPKYALVVKYTPVVCGDGMIGYGEHCDDSNTTAGDGCSATCALEGATAEVEPNEDGTPSLGGVGFAGNDFGFATSATFSANVRIAASFDPAGDEDVFAFTNPAATYVTVRFDLWSPVTGIGMSCGTAIDPALHIRSATGASLASNDDRSATDYCAGLTFGIAPGQTVYAHVVEVDDNNALAAYALDATYTPVVCGDNAIGPGEDCDDGNTTGGDGCSATCVIEATTEVEPNNTSPEATASTVQITGDVVLAGAIATAGDLDRFQVTVTAPTAVRFETFTGTYHQCSTAATLDVRVFDMASTQLSADTAGAGIAQCGALVVYLPAAGTYFVQVEERGNNAIVPAYYLDVSYQDDNGAETEPNETYMTAAPQLLSDNEVFAIGDHVVNTDADVYAITVPAGMRIRAEILEGDSETCESNGIDSRLTLLDDAGVQLVDDDDDGRGYCSMIDGTGATPLDAAARNATAMLKTYYLMVRASTFSQTGAAGQFAYRLQLTLRAQ
jgi:cysteine-rich repeat protein